MSRRARAAIAAALFVAASAMAAIMATHQGIARDEVVYIRYGRGYATWWRDLVTTGEGMNERAITAHFGGPHATDNNREHPPLMKTLFGISELVLADGLGWTSRVFAARLPTALMFGALVALVFLFAAPIWGDRAGLVAAGLTLFLPRLVFHAQLAAFDAAVATLWIAVLVAYYHSLRSRRWCIVLGVTFGLALATKHNALMLPAVILAHMGLCALRDAVHHRRAGAPSFAALWRGLTAFRPLPLLAMAILGPLILFALWPWLWLDPIGHASAWIGFHLHHVHYNFEYLGKNWNAPPYPWHEPVVTALFTIPVVTMALAGLGVAAGASDAWRDKARDGERAPLLLLVLSATVAMGPFLVPFLGTPIFGAGKHWLCALITVTVLAGIGADRAAGAAARALVRAGTVANLHARRADRIAMTVLAVAAIFAAATETLDAQPYGLSHYNALAGGAPGGADLGMNRQFWGGSARGVLPVINRFAPAPGQPAVPVYTHDASPAWGVYARLGLLAPGLPNAGHERAGIRRSKLAIVIHERHFLRHDYIIWDEYGTVSPIFVLTIDGVPLVSVYKRPDPK